MFKNYLKVAFRKLLKHKGYSFINIVCLAIGTTACLLLFLWVQDELSYDRFHENADQIYRVIYQLEVEGREKHSAHTPAALAPALINEFPWIQKAIRFGRGKYLVQYKEKRFSEIGLVADHDVLDVFTFTLLTGDSGTVFKDPKSVVISEEMREKYFGKENPIGKTINIDEKYDLKITGVFENIPRNSHITFDFLRPRYKFPGDYATNWGVANYCTYILISPNAPDDMIETFNKRMPQFVEKHMGKNAREFFKIKFILQHLTDIHLTSDIEGEYEPVGDIETVYIISVIAFFILLIVCINYINLATARFITRAREAGLRRVLGATRSQLIRQSLGESFLTALMSLPLAVLLAELFLPLFNSLSGKPLAFHYLSNPILLPGLAGIILFVGLVSGTAPALFITTTLPTDAMKGVVKAGPVISVLRRVLVVFQFAMSILFIICAMIVYVQIQFTRDKDLGFNKEHVVNIHFNHNKEALLQYDTLKYEFSKHPGVKAVSASIFFPGKRPWINNYWLDGMTAKEYLMIYNIPVDYDFIDTFEIDIVEGRGFSSSFPTDAENAFIINEAARNLFGWQSAVGRNLKIGVDWKKGTIIGVVKDFHFESLHGEVKPVVLFIEPEGFEYISARISPHNIPQTLDYLKSKWEKLVHDQPFVYSFLDEDFDRLHKPEVRLLNIFMSITFLEIFIACLGLLGLAAFTAEQRTKEIGIRKVLGASVPGIVQLLSKEFVRWVLISNIIAWPIAWYAMHRWLLNFAFRIDISPWNFLFAGLLTLVIALLTIGYKAIRAAVTDPVETLRCE